MTVLYTIIAVLVVVIAGLAVDDIRVSRKHARWSTTARRRAAARAAFDVHMDRYSGPPPACVVIGPARTVQHWARTTMLPTGYRLIQVNRARDLYGHDLRNAIVFRVGPAYTLPDIAEIDARVCALVSRYSTSGRTSPY